MQHCATALRVLSLSRARTCVLCRNVYCLLLNVRMLTYYCFKLDQRPDGIDETLQRHPSRQGKSHKNKQYNQGQKRLPPGR